MAKLNDLTSNKVQERKRQVRTYGTKTDLASTVVERGSTHWAEGSNVHIDGLLGVAGTATVSGVLSVTGTLNASGQINLSGSTAITGPLNVTGTTTIGGNTNITGELNVTGPTTLDGVLDIGGDATITGLLDVEGRTTIAADLELLTGGKFIAGQTQIEPTGKATFGDFVIDPSSNKLIEAPGGWLFTSGPDSLGLASSLTSSMNLNSEYAELNYPGATIRARNAGIDLMAPTVIAGTGSNKLTVTPTSATLGGVSTYVRASDGVGIRLFGLPTTANKANLYASADGWVFRSTA